MSDNAPGQLLINLTSSAGNPAGKALRMGRKFLGTGWQVTLLVNVDAVHLVDPDAQLESCPVTGKPIPALLKGFIAEGGRVLVGKECLKVIGRQDMPLPDGCGIATFELLDELLRRPDIRTLTW